MLREWICAYTLIIDALSLEYIKSAECFILLWIEKISRKDEEEGLQSIKGCSEDISS